MTDLITTLLAEAEALQDIADELHDAAASAESEALAAWRVYDEAVNDVEDALTPSEPLDTRFENAV
jgi:hypothetical protein